MPDGALRGGSDARARNNAVPAVNALRPEASSCPAAPSGIVGYLEIEETLAGAIARRAFNYRRSPPPSPSRTPNSAGFPNSIYRKIIGRLMFIRSDRRRADRNWNEDTSQCSFSLSSRSPRLILRMVENRKSESHGRLYNSITRTMRPK